MPVVEVKTYYLEMLAPPGKAVPPPRDGLAVIQAKKPTIAFYRFLYDSVGGNYNWTSRKKLTDAELAALIHDSRMENHVLYVDGVPAGFAELDHRIESEIELVQFGLVPEFIGQGLGRYFLRWTIDKAWSYQPRRLWLHTCTKDHPAALPNYLKAGFVLYKEEIKQQNI
jgi:GNAT superfamily N-acetyltransferase